MLRATIGPVAAMVMADRCGRIIEETARRFELVGTPPALRAARELREGLAELREAGRWLNFSQAEIGSPGRTSEPRSGRDAAASASPPGHLTVKQVAERLEVSTSYVARLCRDQGLSATRPGREWLIDPESVADRQVEEKLR